LNNIVRGVASNRHLPSMFDLATVGILGITFFPDRFLQGTFFVFYSLFIFTLTLLFKPRREYTSTPLVLLILWSLAMVFTHNNIVVVPSSVINFYFNVSIMFEGFIYILCGFLLFRSLITHTKQPLLYLILLPISLIPLLKTGLYTGSTTLGAALAVSLTIYLFIKKEKLLGFLAGITGITIALLIWPWIQMKFICRPYLWIELLKRIGEHPFVGQGFNHTLQPDSMIWIRQIGAVVYGWIYAHNDYLHLASCLGFIVLPLLCWFVVETIRRIGNTIYLIPFLTIAIASFFQITMFLPNKAALCLVVASVCISQRRAV